MAISEQELIDLTTVPPGVEGYPARCFELTMARFVLAKTISDSEDGFFEHTANSYAEAFRTVACEEGVVLGAQTVASQLGRILDLADLSEEVTTEIERSKLADVDRIQASLDHRSRDVGETEIRAVTIAEELLESVATIRTIARAGQVGSSLAVSA